MKAAMTTGGGNKVGWLVSAAVMLPLCGLTCAEHPPATISTAPVALSPCKDAQSWRDQLQILQPNTVLGVEAHYWRNTCDGTAQVMGTRVLLRRPEAPSLAALSWMLRCGGSRVFFGAADPSRSSTGPRWLPGGWLDIEVKPDGGNFVVTLSADSVPKNIELFHRTAELVSAH
jgi:hypothetical protein